MNSWLDALKTHEDEILEEMKDAQRLAMRYPKCEYRVYLDTNGEVGNEEWIQGDHGWYKFRDENYDRFYIHTYDNVSFDTIGEYFPTRSDFFEYAERQWNLRVDDEEYSPYDCDFLTFARNFYIDHGIDEDAYDRWMDDVFDEAIEFFIDLMDHDGVFERQFHQALRYAESEED